MNADSPAEEEAKLVMDIYDYALTHSMNVESRDDVTKILQALNQENMSDERVDRLMTMLQITAKRIQSDLDRRKKVN